MPRKTAWAPSCSSPSRSPGTTGCPRGARRPTCWTARRRRSGILSPSRCPGMISRPISTGRGTSRARNRAAGWSSGCSTGPEAAIPTRRPCGCVSARATRRSASNSSIDVPHASRIAAVKTEKSVRSRLRSGRFSFGGDPYCRLTPSCFPAVRLPGRSYSRGGYSWVGSVWRDSLQHGSVRCSSSRADSPRRGSCGRGRRLTRASSGRTFEVIQR